MTLHDFIVWYMASRVNCRVACFSLSFSSSPFSYLKLLKLPQQNYVIEQKLPNIGVITLPLKGALCTQVIRLSSFL